MNGMIIYESLSHIDDAFILGSMPSPVKKMSKKPRFQALWIYDQEFHASRECIYGYVRL